MRFRKFEEIEAWKSARELVREIYRITDKPPLAQDFAFRDQLRRAAVSSMSNIAEGFESGQKANFVRFLNYAKASAGEARSQLYVALDMNYLSREEFEIIYDLADRTVRQISNLIHYLKTSRPPGTPSASKA